MMVKVELLKPIKDPQGIFKTIEYLWFDTLELCKLPNPIACKLVAKKYKKDLKCFVLEMITFKKCKALGVWMAGAGVVSVDRLRREKQEQE